MCHFFLLLRFFRLGNNSFQESMNERLVEWLRILIFIENQFRFSKTFMKMFPRTACIIDSVNEYRKYRLLLFKAVHIGKIHNKSGIRSFRISIGRELPLASNNVHAQKRKLPFNFSFNCNFQKRVEIINFPELRFYQIIVSSRVSSPPGKI